MNFVIGILAGVLSIYWVLKGDLALFAVCGIASAVFLGLYAGEKKSK